MIYPPLFQIINSDSTVQSLLGTNPVRVFPFGRAPDRIALPYAVHQIVTGVPENYISNGPDLDSFTVQVDVYAATPNSARAAAEALRDAIEPHAHIVAWRGESQEPETSRFRFSFDVEFLTAR